MTAESFALISVALLMVAIAILLLSVAACTVKDTFLSGARKKEPMEKPQFEERESEECGANNKVDSPTAELWRKIGACSSVIVGACCLIIVVLCVVFAVYFLGLKEVSCDRIATAVMLASLLGVFCFVVAFFVIRINMLSGREAAECRETVLATLKIASFSIAAVPVAEAVLLYATRALLLE